MHPDEGKQGWRPSDGNTVYGDDLEQFCAMLESGIMALEWARLRAAAQKELAALEEWVPCRPAPASTPRRWWQSTRETPS